MDPFQALGKLPKLIEEYKKAAAELAEVKRELELLKDDQYVTWEWVCTYFGVSRTTASVMLADEKLFVFGQQIKRFKRSAIIRFAEKNSLNVKEIAPLPSLGGMHSKRRNK